MQVRRAVHVISVACVIKPPVAVTSAQRAHLRGVRRMTRVVSDVRVIVVNGHVVEWTGVLVDGLFRGRRARSVRCVAALQGAVDDVRHAGGGRSEGGA